MRRAACFSRWLSPRDRGVVLDDRLRCDEDDRFFFAIPKDFVFEVFDLIVERLRPGKFDLESSADIFRAHPTPTSYCRFSASFDAALAARMSLAYTHWSRCLLDLMYSVGWAAASL